MAIVQGGCDDLRVAQALNAIKRAPGNYMPPMVLSCVEHDLSASRRPRTERDPLEERVAYLRRMIEITDNDETVESLQEELALMQDGGNEEAQRRAL